MLCNAAVLHVNASSFDRFLLLYDQQLRCVQHTRMEYFTVKALSGGFLAICVKGRDLSILKSMNKRTYLPLFRKCFSHQVLCCSVEELRVNDLSWVNQASAVKDFIVAVGLSDGSVILVNVRWDGAEVYDVILLNHPVGALHCGVGFVFASSISGECTLLYPEPSSARQERLRFIRMDVNLVPTKVTGKSLWQRSQCSVPSTVTSFPTHSKGCSADMQEQLDLVLSYFDESASLLTSVSSANASSTNAKITESELLLIGCTDGTLWWLQTPSRSSVLELYTDDTDSMDENHARRLPAQLFHTFHTSVQQVLFTGLSLRPEKVPNELSKLSNCVTSICVVECCGKATLLGMSSSTSKSTRTFQFPAHCNLSSILYYNGVFLYIDDRSGMLCAISVDTALYTTDKNTSKSAGIARVIEHILTPTTSPRIQSCSILTTNDTNNAQCDMILLRINDGALVPLSLPFENSDSGVNTMEVIAALQRACGGGALRHPFTLAPVQVHTSNEHSDPQVDSVIVSTASNNSTATTNDTEMAKLEQVASQLCEVGEENEHILKQILQADLEVLQLTALLQELPGTLQIVCGDNGIAKPESTNCAVLCNPARSIHMRYRFRTEPAPHSFASSSSSSSSGDKCTYMDISISARSVQAMRALQGRTMTISVQSTFGTTALYCRGDTSSAQILLQPVLTSGEENINNTCEFEYTTTISMDHLNQLSSYRLVLSVLVDAPRAISTACSDGMAHVTDSNSTMLCIVDHIIPLSEVLPYILTACNDSALASLQHLCGNQSTNRTEYTLTINPSTADSHSIINRYQRAINKNTQYTDHQYNTALRGDNLLQAAFPPHKGSATTIDTASEMTAAFHLGSASVGLGTTRIGSHTQPRRRAQKQQLTLSTARTATNVTGTGGATSTQKHTLNTNRMLMNNSSRSSKANQSQRVISVPSSATSACTPLAQSNSASTQSGRTNSSSSRNSGNDSTGSCVTISSNSAALLASIASEMHVSELRDLSNCSNGQCLTSADFTDADAAYLDAELQQIMVQAAHLARENDPDNFVENKTLSCSDDANVGARLWTIYSSLRRNVL